MYFAIEIIDWVGDMMQISKQGRWVLVIAVFLLIAAIAAGIHDIKNNSGFAGAEREYVAVIRIDGTIYGGPETSPLWGAGGGAPSEQIMAELSEARKDPHAKAVLLRMNTPGGSTGATQEVAEEIDRIRSAGKPVIVSMGDTCASAGYWLASKGDYIFASPATLTGSIGVYMDYTNVGELMDKLGIKNEKIKSGAHKDILSMYRPMTAEERQMLQAMVDDIYEQFVNTVADGRRMDVSKVKTFADGRILTGRQAQDLGLVDAMGNYYDALSYAGSAGGIESETVPTKSYAGRRVSLKDVLSGEADTLADEISGKITGKLFTSLKDPAYPAVR